MSRERAVINQEGRALFNPVFCAVLLHKAVFGYQSKCGSALPVSFAFLMLPNALHKPTRDVLPLRTTASMWKWMQEHPEVMAGFTDRAIQMKPTSSAAIRFGVQHQLLEGSRDGLRPLNLGRRSRGIGFTEDWESCAKAAEFFGKWFATIESDEATTLARWGVRP